MSFRSILGMPSLFFDSMIVPSNKLQSFCANAASILVSKTAIGGHDAGWARVWHGSCSS